MARVVLEQATKHFETADGPATALEEVDLVIESGEFLLLTGPSGSGKTTLLRVIAGLERLNSGRLTIGGADMAQVPPHARNVAMVFQHPALYPHMTARENIEFGLKLRGCPAGERARRTDEVAGLLGIGELLSRRPSELSGGQSQRVALGRAWVRKPDVFLLDEPFTSLETELRAQLRRHVRTLQSTIRATTIVVSHDPEDIAEHTGRIALLNAGRLVQTGTAETFKKSPTNRFAEEYTRDWPGKET